MAKVLIIDDDVNLCKVLSKEINFLGYESVTSNTLKDGYELAVTDKFDVVFLDVRLPDGNGIDIIHGIRRLEEAPEVIIITGTGDADGAEMAIKNGAWDYIQKPSSLKQMTLPLIRALEYRQARQASKAAMILSLEGLVGNSPQIRSCLELVAQFAASDANVLITGETGTGKEVIALASHRNSSRAKEEFIVVDCASITETLMESVLFGHEKGAFTGADKFRAGLITAAHKGTLLLDEVGELSLTMQRTLLRVLQDRRFRRVGSDREIESNFRLIAATNRNLDDMVKKGQFREDLLHRLRSFVIQLPPLRDREGDVRQLTSYFVARICDRYKMKTKGLSPDFLDILSTYSWPGNVRELQHTLEQIIARAQNSEILYPEHVPANIRIHAARASFASLDDNAAPESTDSLASFPTLKDYKRLAEEKYLTELIRRANGNIGEACHLSGTSRANLYLLLKSHNKTLNK